MGTLCYTMCMKNPEIPSVKQAVERGMKVSLPNLLDDYYLMKEDNPSIREYDLLWYLASEVSYKYDISHNQASSVVEYSLSSLGVKI